MNPDKRARTLSLRRRPGSTIARAKLPLSIHFDFLNEVDAYETKSKTRARHRVILRPRLSSRKRSARALSWVSKNSLQFRTPCGHQVCNLGHQLDTKAVSC